MRSSFERYGGYIALDTMKRETSCNNLWTPFDKAVVVGQPLAVLLLVPPLCHSGILGLAMSASNPSGYTQPELVRGFAYAHPAWPTRESASTCCIAPLLMLYVTVWQ